MARGISQADETRARADRINEKFEHVQEAVDRGGEVQQPPVRLNDRRGASSVLSIPSIPTSMSNLAW